MKKGGLDLIRLRQILEKHYPWPERIKTYDRVPSTQSMAISAGNMGAPEGTLIIAGQQVAGRGRGNHKWFSPPGGLYASLVLRPSIDIEKWPVLSLMGGVAVARAIRILGVAASLKWPNDVNIHGRKVAGCLAGAVPEKGFVVLGVGVNIRWQDAILPDELSGFITRVYEHLSEAPTPEEISSSILTGILNLYRTTSADFETELANINALLDHEGMYTFKDLTGFQVEVLPDLSLRLQDQTGENHILGMDYAARD